MQTEKLFEIQRLIDQMKLDFCLFHFFLIKLLAQTDLQDFVCLKNRI
jgi:hypothetical protein